MAQTDEDEFLQFLLAGTRFPPTEGFTKKLEQWLKSDEPKIRAYHVEKRDENILMVLDGDNYVQGRPKWVWSGIDCIWRSPEDNLPVMHQTSLWLAFDAFFQKTPERPNI